MEESISHIDSLLLSFLKEEITEAERKKLEDWINADISNKDYFRSFYRIWNITNPVDDDVETVLQKVKFKLRNTPFENMDGQKDTGLLFTLLKWAAVIVISCITGAMGYKYLLNNGMNANNKSFTNVINVPLGSKSNIVLPDGTEVTLNAGSKLTYGMDYGTKLREVSLVGEGYFKVKENKKIPFIVKTVKATIKALGTEFNVKAYPEENTIETVLVKGSVLVSEILTSEVSRPDKRKEVILLPGQKVQIFKNAENTEKTLVEAQQSFQEKNSARTAKPTEMIVAKTEAETETSWKDSRWIIKGTDLKTLAILLSRRFNVTIHLQDEDLKQYRFSGTIENETVEEVFNIMQYTIPVSYTVEKGKVTWTLNRNLEKVYKESY